MGKTSAEVINRYTKKTYATFRFMVRLDDKLFEAIKAYDGNLSDLIRELLRKHLTGE